jgi:hypothetical protein
LIRSALHDHDLAVHFVSVNEQANRPEDRDEGNGKRRRHDQIAGREATR